MRGWLRCVCVKLCRRFAKMFLWLLARRASGCVLWHACSAGFMISLTLRLAYPPHLAAAKLHQNFNDHHCCPPSNATMLVVWLSARVLMQRRPVVPRTMEVHRAKTCRAGGPAYLEWRRPDRP